MGFSALTRAKTEENNGFRTPLPYVFAARRTVGLLSSASILVRAGADLLICPDNTLHQALDLVRRQAPAPWLHIVEEVAAVAARRGFKRLGILGTKYLMEGPVYREKLAARGIAHEIPEGDDRERINAIIFNELVYGRLEESSKRYFRSVIEILGARGCDAVILGCTEIPLLVTDTESPLPAIDSTRTLARAALREATRSVSARGLRAGRESSTVGAAMPTSKVHPARSVVPAATASKSTKASAEKSAAAKAKTSNSPSAGKGLPRNLEESGSFRRRT